MVGSPPAIVSNAASSSSSSSSSSSLAADSAASNASFSNTTDALHTITEGDQNEDGAEAAAAALPLTLTQQLAAAHSTGVAPTDVQARSVRWQGNNGHEQNSVIFPRKLFRVDHQAIFWSCI
jgi:hypothetical protein